MKLFLFCTLTTVLGVARGVDVKCQPHDHSTYCKIIEPVTMKTDEKLNIISDVNLESIYELTFVTRNDDSSKLLTVPSEIFQQSPNITTLNVSPAAEVSNQLKTIPAGFLSLAKNLESMTLWDNKIAEIEDNAFNGPNKLLHINLQNNNLTIIKQNTFNGLDKLEYLNVADNQIESIEENALNLPNLKILFMYNNKLTTLPDNLFSATPLLETLRASKNQINHIGKSLYGLKKLEALSLKQNKLTDVDLVAFSQLPTLATLNLDGNGLTSDKISKIEIKEESKSVLGYLSLDHNELTDKDDLKKVGIVFPHLVAIDVQNNKYSKIDLGNKTLRQQFIKLELVFISSGEWSCEWLENFIESSKDDGIDVRTTEPADTNGKNVNNIGCA